MLITNIKNFSELNTLKAKVELYNGSTLVTTCTCADVLSDFSVSREGESGKFFGFGVGHKLNLKLIDLLKVISLQEGFTAKICLGDGTDFDCPYPDFNLTNISVDKKSGDIKITGYDVLYKASELTYADLDIEAPYTIKTLTEAIARLLGIEVVGLNESFNLNYLEGGNFNESDTIRSILNAIAEVTLTIYFINNENKLVFKKLSSTPVKEYYEGDYYEFETAETKVLKGIGSATELGENYIAEATDISDGVTQFIRNNGLLELRADLPSFLDSAIDELKGSYLCQFELDWSGDHLLEIGDAIAIYNDGEAVILQILNDVIQYGGTLNEKTSWSYSEGGEETFANPTTISEKLTQTFAKVDKVNKQVDIVASEMNDTKEAISTLRINTDSISTSVSRQEESILNLSNDIANVNNRVDATITADDVKLQIQEELSTGVNQITTTTGFTFNDIGLTVSKTDSEITTTITEDGMKVAKGDNEVLTASNEGVTAIDLKATTYLIVGKNSRFEDFDNTRTGCFWIGIGGY